MGLMVGLEILHPLTAAERADVHCSTRRPWEAAASAIVYAMRARRILLSTDGMVRAYVYTYIHDERYTLSAVDLISYPAH